MSLCRRLTLYAVASSAALFLHTGQAGEGPGMAGERLDGYFSDLVTLSADFEQTLFDEMGEVVQVSSGTLAVERPGRFRWDYSEPYEQLIVSDGKFVWLYDADLEQVTVRALDETLANTPAMLLSGDSRLTERFLISQSNQGEETGWITLTPRQGDTDFKTVELEFQEEELVAMRLSDTLDQVTTIRFGEVFRNLELDPALFGFEPPDGVDVIGDLENDEPTELAEGGT